MMLIGTSQSCFIQNSDMKENSLQLQKSSNSLFFILANTVTANAVLSIFFFLKEEEKIPSETKVALIICYSVFNSSYLQYQLFLLFYAMSLSTVFSFHKCCELALWSLAVSSSLYYQYVIGMLFKCFSLMVIIYLYDIHDYNNTNTLNTKWIKWP